MNSFKTDVISSNKSYIINQLEVIHKRTKSDSNINNEECCKHLIDGINVTIKSILDQSERAKRDELNELRKLYNESKAKTSKSSLNKPKYCKLSEESKKQILERNEKESTERKKRYDEILGLINSDIEKINKKIQIFSCMLLIFVITFCREDIII